jgi:hypothetical protein
LFSISVYEINGGNITCCIALSYYSFGMKKQNIRANEKDSLPDVLLGITLLPVWILLQCFRLIYWTMFRVPTYRNMPIGIFRLAIVFWIICAISKDGGNIFFPHETYYINYIDFLNFIFSKTLEESIELLLSVILIINFFVQLLVAFGLHRSEQFTVQVENNSRFPSIIKTMEIRDMEMNQMSTKEKVKEMAKTGFITKRNFENDLTTNEEKAFESLDMELEQESTQGKLKKLKELFKGN